MKNLVMNTYSNSSTKEGTLITMLSGGLIVVFPPKEAKALMKFNKVKDVKSLALWQSFIGIPDKYIKEKCLKGSYKKIDNVTLFIVSKSGEDTLDKLF